MAISSNISVRGMLHRAARWYGEREAIVDETQRCTYAGLLDRAQRCAHLLYQLGVRKGDRVALLTYPSVEHFVTWFAAVELGAIPVALHVREAPHVLARVVERLSAKVLVFDGELEGVAVQMHTAAPGPHYGSIRIIVEGAKADSAGARLQADFEIPLDLAAAPRHAGTVSVVESDPAVIVLSSGTTALPKGVIHTNRTIMESARGGCYLWKCDGRDISVNMMSTSFIGWLNLSLPILNVCGKLVIARRFHPQVFLKLLEREKATIAFLIPTMWRLLFNDVDQDSFDLSHIRLAGFAGEIMDPTTLLKIQQKICPEVVNVYGTTETGSCSAGSIMYVNDMVGGRLRSVGRPMLNADIRIIQAGGTVKDELPNGERGEVVITGPSVASQLWDDAEMAGRIFESDGVNTWWHSGDMGYLDEGGFLYLVGRTDDMIISGGINVNPSSIEEALLSHPDVIECAVVGVPDETFGQRVVAFVVARRIALTSDDLNDFMLSKADVAHYQRPREYRFLDALPKTSTGKIRRQELRASQGPRAGH